MRGHMTFFEGKARWNNLAMILGALALTACASEDRDDVTGSRLERR